MIYNASESDDRRPLTYMYGVPVYATTVLVGLHVVAMITMTLLMAVGAQDLVALLGFSSTAAFSKGWLWQFFTYAFLNGPSIWFAIEMLLLYRFGREVEQYLGRRLFLRLYVMLLLFVPALLSLAGVFRPMEYAGSGALHFAVFVAFAAVYPGVDVFFGVRAKWVAAVLMGIYTLQFMAYGAWASLIAIWGAVTLTVLYICHARGQFSFSGWRFWQKEPQFHVVRDEEFDPGDPDSVESIDPLLEKISRSGISSLTRKERARLEKAREALIKRGK